jgi:hypothetical protein
MALSTEDDEKPSTRSSQDKIATPGILLPPQGESLASLDDDNSEDKSSDSSLSRTWRKIEDTKIYHFLSYTPERCRWDPEAPPKFSMALNCLFAFAGAFTVANLYYSHPILNILARDFDVSYEQISQVPTLAQAGYAVGLGLLCPLGDVFKRRPFTLLLVLFTATVW